MNDDGNAGLLRKRRFTSDVPEHLLHGKSESEMWIYNQLSIARQQNEAIMDRLDQGEHRFDEHGKAIETVKTSVGKVQQRVEVFEKIRDRLTAKWSVVVFILGALLSPIVVACIGGLFIRFWEKIWK
jgi:fatty acid-binding protein DegV